MRRQKFAKLPSLAVGILAEVLQNGLRFLAVALLGVGRSPIQHDGAELRVLHLADQLNVERSGTPVVFLYLRVKALLLRSNLKELAK